MLAFTYGYGHCREQHNLLYQGGDYVIISVFNVFRMLTYWGLVTQYGDTDRVNIGSGIGFSPDDTKPSPELMLTYNQWCFVAFTRGQLCRNCSTKRVRILYSLKPLPHLSRFNELATYSIELYKTHWLMPCRRCGQGIKHTVKIFLKCE